MSSAIGGAMPPRAPQLFTMPETADHGTVERVKRAAAEIGARLRVLHPDLRIIFANNHADQFFHTAAPPFTIHVGDDAKGEFAGRQFHWRAPGEIGLAVVREMHGQGFDPAFTSVAKIDYALGIPLTDMLRSAALAHGLKVGRNASLMLRGRQSPVAAHALHRRAPA
jgi:2,3-dihydroxyphenylpropionate 1,2-dioxygenase